MNRWHIRLACEAVLAGGVIAYPSEAVYGLGCSPWNEQAIARILRMKRRSHTKGLIIVAADIAQLQALVDFERINDLQSILQTWPGPLTWVLPVRRGVPAILSGAHRDLAVRVTAHPQLREMCRICGPLVSTSANLDKAPPARNRLGVRNYFRRQVDYVLGGKLGDAAGPTEIRHPDGTILRPAT